MRLKVKKNKPTVKVKARPEGEAPAVTAKVVLKTEIKIIPITTYKISETVHYQSGVSSTFVGEFYSKPIALRVAKMLLKRAVNGTLEE